MKLLTCPINGTRNINEFQWGGEVRPALDPAHASEAEWADHLFLERNAAGEIAEWWLHVPTSTWFIARRNTTTDTVIETMTPDAFFALNPGRG